MLSLKMKFNQAKQACQDEGSVLAMPRTVEDISDIKEFDCEYSVMKWVSVRCCDTIWLRAKQHSAAS